MEKSSFKLEHPLGVIVGNFFEDSNLLDLRQSFDNKSLNIAHSIDICTHPTTYTASSSLPSSFNLFSIEIRITMEMTKISKLSSTHQNWTLQVLLLEMDNIKKFKSGQGRIQKLTLMDKDGSKIHALMFNEIIDKFQNILHLGKNYIISNGQIKKINSHFYNVNENFEIILNKFTEISECQSEIIFAQHSSFATIEHIQAKPNSPSDVLLLVKNVGEIRTIFRNRDKKEILKRDLQVIGYRSEKIIFTLWESLATIEGEELKDMIGQFPIILAKHIIGKNFNGFHLSTTASTTIEINPDLAELKDIMEWFREKKIESNESEAEEVSFTDLSKVNNSEVSTEEITYYEIKVCIKAIKNERNLWYESCNVCKSKVIGNGELFECIKCSNNHADCSLRYLIKLEVEDRTSTSILTLFHNEAANLLGIPVDDVKKLKEENIDEFYKVLSSVNDREEIFSIKAQDKIYGNRSLRSLTVISRRMEAAMDAPNKKIKLAIH